MDERKAELLRQLQKRSATLIQKRYRGVLGRRRARRVGHEKRMRLLRIKRASLYIQKMYRGQCGGFPGAAWVGAESGVGDTLRF